jgi:hypothetical protein
MSRFLVVCCAALVGLCLNSSALLAEAPRSDEPAQITDVRLGFNGVYKGGYWTPLEVVIQSREPDGAARDLTLSLADGDGLAVSTVPQRVTVSDQETVVRTLVKPGRPKPTIDVALRGAGDDVVARTFVLDDERQKPLLATQELVVEVGRPVGMERLQQFYPAASLERPAAALVKDPRALSEEWRGYDGVDLVVVTTSDLAALRGWNARQSEALAQWVRLGGKVMVCAGRNAGELAKGSESDDAANGPDAADAASPQLAWLAPGRFEAVIDHGPGPWESFAGALTQPMQGADGGRPEPIPTGKFTDVRGRVELGDGEIPLVVRTPQGFGEVLFVAADLDRPPFFEWPARGKLLLRLLGRSDPSGDASAARANTAEGIRLGYTDLSGQLRSAMGQYRGAAMTPFWLVFFLALLYAAALYPLEYAITRWLRPRFEAAWIVLPLVLIAATGGVWYLAGRWKGDDVLANKLDVVDVDLATGAMRGQTWCSLYSPRTDSYDIALRPVGDMATMAQAELSWLGLPGSGLGGMNSQIVEPAQFERGYRCGEDGSLVGVPVAAWSSKAFEASWLGQGRAGSTELDERATDRQPLGTLKNETGMTLNDAVLFYEGWAYPLGTLAPGAAVDVGRIQRLQSVSSYLTGRRTIGEKEQATPYEPDGVDVARIARMMMFHDAAGGRQYTSLSNRYFDRLDMTEPLRFGRAVLLAAGPPATSLSLASTSGSEPRIEDERAYYRFVIPVNRRGRSEEPPVVELRLD